MKKRIFVFVTSLILLTTVSCGGSGSIEPVTPTESQEKTIAPGDTIFVKNKMLDEDALEVKLNRVEFTSEIYSNYRDNGYYQSKEGEVFFHIDIELKNLLTEESGMYKKCSVSVDFGNDNIYECFVCEDDPERGLSFRLIQSYSQVSLKAQETQHIHFLANCPAELDRENGSFTVTFLLDGKEYVYRSDISTLHPTPIPAEGKSFAQGDTIITEKTEIIIKKIKFSYQIPTTGFLGRKGYYIPEEGKIFLVVEVEVKNTTREKINDSALGRLSVHYDHEEYKAVTRVGPDYSEKYLNEIEAGETAVIRFISNCPAEMDSAEENALQIVLKIGRENFIHETTTAALHLPEIPFSEQLFVPGETIVTENAEIVIHSIEFTYEIPRFFETGRSSLYYVPEDGDVFLLLKRP